MTDPKQIVRDGYDKVSLVYRSGNETDDDPVYARWTARLANDLAPSARLLDLGCGCGVPTTRALAALGSVVGVDISPVQIERARSLVPAAEFLCEDMSALRFPPGSFDAVVSFYAIIHVPLEEQPDLFKRIANWLKSGGLFVATLGSGAWIGTEQDWLGGRGRRDVLEPHGFTDLQGLAGGSRDGAARRRAHRRSGEPAGPSRVLREAKASFTGTTR